jgi:hypothetical protein
MKRAITSFLLASCAGLAFGGGVNAADITYPELAPTPTLQQLAFSSLFDAWAGVRRLTSTDDPDDSTHLTAGGNAYVNVPLGQSFSAQLDFQGEYFNDNGVQAPQGNIMGGLHLSWRDPTHYLLGAFAGVGKPFNHDPCDDDCGYSGVGYIVGGEGQVYVGNFTFYGQAGYGDFKTDFNDGPEGFVNGWFLRAVGRYFVNDDFMISAEYSFGHTNCYIDGLCASGGEDAGEFHNWGAKARFRLPHHTTMPVYGFLEYAGGTYLATEDPDRATEHSFRIGLSVLFGNAPTLIANDRYGATLETPMLPVRAANFGEALD